MAASPEPPTTTSKRPAYRYSSLSSHPNSIRLLRLLAAPQAADPIKCQIFNYSLTSPPRTSHLYECLSYVWGDVKDKPLIEVDGAEVAVTKNLHGALQRLRDPELDRVLWVDAVCINQDDIEERAQQVQFMAMIYAYASRVIVWLGEEADGSNVAMELLREEASRGYRRQKTLEDANEDGMGEEDDIISRGGENMRDKDTGESHDDVGARKNAQDHVVALLRRPWFQRIWVLQEIAAARVMTVLCGAEEITGAGFHRGLSGILKLYDDADLHSIVAPMIYLLGDASVLRLKKYTAGEPFRLDICPLYQLIDMFRLREATDRRDKVYALLGIASQNQVGCEIVPDYATEWSTVFRDLARSILGPEIDADWVVNDGRGYGQLSGRGFILGHVSAVDSIKGELQTVVLQPRLRYRSRPQRNYPVKEEFRWNLHNSTTAVKEGDMICCLKGSTSATIIRPQGNLFTIVIVFAKLPKDLVKNVFQQKYRNKSAVGSSPFQYNRQLHLVWAFDLDWKTSQLRTAQQSLGSPEHILRISSMAQSLEDVNRTDCITELVKYANERFQHIRDLPAEAVDHFRHLSRAMPNWSLYLHLKSFLKDTLTLQRIPPGDNSAVGLLVDVELDIVEFQLQLCASIEVGTAIVKRLLERNLRMSPFLIISFRNSTEYEDYGMMLALLFDVWGPVFAPQSILESIRYIEFLSPSDRSSTEYFYDARPMEVVEVLLKATTEYSEWGRAMLEHLFEFAKGDVNRMYCILRALVVCSSASLQWKHTVVECIFATHQGEFAPDAATGPEECYAGALEFLWDFYIIPAKDFVAISPSGAYQLRRQLLETFVSDYKFWKACYDGRTEVVQNHARFRVGSNFLQMCKDTRGRWCRVSGPEAAAMNGHVDCFRTLQERGFADQITVPVWNHLCECVHVPEEKREQLTKLIIPERRETEVFRLMTRRHS